MSKPNVLLICTDQQRFDSLGCTGNGLIRTPHIDDIARRGVVFSRHFTPNQICMPSRATMFTGLYPRHHGLCHNGIAFDESLPNLAGLLANAGYQTGAVGKMHFQPWRAPANLRLPESSAFWRQERALDWNGPFYGLQTVKLLLGDGADCTKAGHYGLWVTERDPQAHALFLRASALETPPEEITDCWKSAVPQELHPNTWIAETSVALLEEMISPFFLFVSFNDPHHPVSPPRPYCDAYAPDSMPAPARRAGELERMPDYLFRPLHAHEQGRLTRTESIREESLSTVMAGTYGMIEMVDASIGRLLRKLDQLDQLDNTIVMFTSDHGELLGDHYLLRKGPPPYRQLLQVPLLMCGPRIPRGRTVEALTGHIDLVPTILDLVGEQEAPTVDGPAIDCPTVDGTSLLPLIQGRSSTVREFLFAEYHPRAQHELYNQSIITQQWRLTLYPHHPEWGELFDLAVDSTENNNLFTQQATQLAGLLEREFPPCPQVKAPMIALW